MVYNVDILSKVNLNSNPNLILWMLKWARLLSFHVLTTELISTHFDWYRDKWNLVKKYIDYFLSRK